MEITPTDNTPVEPVIENAEVTPPAEPTPDPVEDVVLPSDVEEFTMPEKFEGKSAEDIAKAYAELEKLQSKKEETPPDDGEEASKGVVTRAMLDEYVEKARENGGELSEEHYAELAAKGIDKDTVDVYAKGVKAEQAEEARAILTTAGTDEAGFQEAAQWARENWSQERIDRMNNTLNTATGDVLINAIESLVNESKGRTTTPREPVHAGGDRATPQRGYANESEMYKDMTDPRYTSDRTFYNAVRKKVEATTAF